MNKHTQMLAFKQKIKNNRGDNINRIVCVLEFEEGKNDPVMLIQDFYLLPKEQFLSCLTDGGLRLVAIREITHSGMHFVYCCNTISIKVHSFMTIANIIANQIGLELLTMLNKLHADVSKKNVVDTGEFVRPLGDTLN